MNARNEKKSPLEQTYTIALYQSLKYGWGHTAEFYGADDSQYHGDDYVRISEPLKIKFTGLTSEEAIQNAVATLDAAERKVRLECEQRVQEIREQKKNLLALTYQPAPANDV